jgi:hypothetical protein
MNVLFDHADKVLKFQRNLSERLHIREVLNPFTETFIDERTAEELGIVRNGYYCNR